MSLESKRSKKLMEVNSERKASKNAPSERNITKWGKPILLNDNWMEKDPGPIAFYPEGFGEDRFVGDSCT